jgi:hypothetical protein
VCIFVEFRLPILLHWRLLPFLIMFENVMKSGFIGLSSAVARRFLLFLFLVLSASQSAFASASDAGLDAVLSPKHLVLFGEIHGTAEAPAVFSSAVCRALEQGHEVSVGLEFNRDQAEALRIYLASEGNKAVVEGLLHSPFWSRAMQDGRSSVAMLDMVEHLRQLQHRYPTLSVFVLYEQIDSAAAGATPDEIMANRVRLERVRRPQALMLVLVGNYHTRLRSEGTETPAPPNARNAPKPMGGLLADLSPLSILLQPNGGSAWICTPECRIQTLATHQDLRTGSSTAYRVLDKDALYSAALSIGSTTASPPAIQKQ